MNIIAIEFIIVLILSVLYIYFVYNSILPHFQRIIYPLNNVVRINLVATLFGFLFNLKSFLAAGMLIFDDYYGKGHLIKGILLFPFFLLISYVISISIFQLTIQIMNILSKENIKAELVRNNYLIGGIQSVFFIFLCLISSEPIIKLVLHFIQ